MTSYQLALQGLFQQLVHPLHLSIRLQVLCCQELQFHPHHIEEMTLESPSKTCIIIIHNVCWDLKQFDYMAVKLFCYSPCRSILWHRFEDTILRKPIHHNHDSTKTFNIREVTDEIHRTDTQDFSRISRCYNKLVSMRSSTLSYWQTRHILTYDSMSFSIFSQKPKCVKSVSILSHPICPAYCTS